MLRSYPDWAPDWELPARAGAESRRRWHREMTWLIHGALDWRAEETMKRVNKYWLERCKRGDDIASEIFVSSPAERVTELRRLHPEIAEFIHLPRKGQRGKYPRRREAGPVEMAVMDTAFVRMLWREIYGRKNRRQGDLSAESIVVKYYADMDKELGTRDFVEVTEDGIRKRAAKYRIPAEVTRQDAELAREFAGL